MKKNYSTVLSAKYLGDYRLEITFRDGVVKKIDLQNLLENSTHPLTRKFLDKELFKQFYVDRITICWGDNEFDLNPFNIYDGKYDIKTENVKSKQKLELVD
jgi:hypothetical protein